MQAGKTVLAMSINLCILNADKASSSFGISLKYHILGNYTTSQKLISNEILQTTMR